METQSPKGMELLHYLIDIFTIETDPFFVFHQNC